MNDRLKAWLFYKEREYEKADSSEMESDDYLLYADIRSLFSERLKLKHRLEEAENLLDWINSESGIHGVTEIKKYFEKYKRVEK